MNYVPKRISHNFVSVWNWKYLVSAYENGKHLPSLKSLIKMADLFHVSTDYLIGRSDVRKVSPDEVLPNEDLALLDCFHDLDTVDKARLVAYAQGLSDKTLKD